MGMDWELAAPLAPKDGFYNERYRCKTMASFDMGDPDEFEKLFCGDEEAPTSPNPSPSPSPSASPNPLPRSRTRARTRTRSRRVSVSRSRARASTTTTARWSVAHRPPPTTHRPPPTTYHSPHASQDIKRYLVDPRCLCKSLWLNDNKIRHDVRRSTT